MESTYISRSWIWLLLSLSSQQGVSIIMIAEDGYWCLEYWSKQKRGCCHEESISSERKTGKLTDANQLSNTVIFSAVEWIKDWLVYILTDSLLAQNENQSEAMSSFGNCLKEARQGHWWQEREKIPQWPFSLKLFLFLVDCKQISWTFNNLFV